MTLLSPAQRRLHLAALRLFASSGNSQVSISDLAAEAGVARGTIYNNLGTTEELFETIASQLSAEMHERVRLSFAGLEDPAQRLANGMRLFIRRAHEEPHWGAFLQRFAKNTASLKEMFANQVLQDLLQGLASGRYSFRQEQMVAVITLIGGSVLDAIYLVREGYRGWRDTGADATELVLRALGVSPDEARAIANAELPPLPELS